MTDFEDLKEQLSLLYKTEKRIAEIINRHGLRFSINKVTADIGEFYTYNVLSSKRDIFKSITQEINSNSDCDFIGVLEKDSILNEYFNTQIIKIEVKTRRNQKGSKYLGGVKPEKFDLLCMVDLNQDYTLNQIFLVESNTARNHLDVKYGRLIFKEEMSFLRLYEDGV